MKQEENEIKLRSKEFAIRIVKLYQYLTESISRKEYIMSKQILRCGTSVGANIAESTYAQSRADFVSKMSIALKEAAETEYWLDLLEKTGYLTTDMADSLNHDCLSLIKLLTSIVKTTKAN